MSCCSAVRRSPGVCGTSPTSTAAVGLDLQGKSAVADRYTENLWLSLRESDPQAFDGAESWWSMVIDTLMNRNFIAETRAYLEQPRVEVASTLSE